MRRLLFLALCLFFVLFAAGCSTTPPKQSLTPMERQALMEARKRRIQSVMNTRFGLPEDVLSMLARREAREAERMRAASLPSLPPVTRPSTIPGVRRMLIVGDSFAVGIGMTMSGQIKGMGVRLAEKGKVSSGLNSPRFYNWEHKLVEFIENERPDVLIAMISGNDAHNGSASQSWKENYIQRVERFVSLAADAGVAVYLVGLPPMGKPDYSQRANVANQAVRQVCNDSGTCHYVDTWALFSDQNGNYIRVKQFNGKPVTLRAKDGVHFTMNGYRILSSAILERIAATYPRTAME